MTYEEALRKIYDMDMDILRNAFQTYAYLKDYAGSSLYDSLLSLHYYQIMKEKDIISEFSGKTFDLASLYEEYPDIPEQEFKDAFLPLLSLYGIKARRIPGTLKPAAQKKKKNPEVRNPSVKKYLPLLKNHRNTLPMALVRKVRISSTIGDVMIERSTDGYAKIDSKCSSLRLKYRIENDTMFLSFTYQKKSKAEAKIRIGIPRCIEETTVKTSKRSIYAEGPLRSVILSSDEGYVFYSGIADKVSLSSKRGLITFKGKSNSITVRGRKDSMKIPHDIISYRIMRSWNLGLYEVHYQRRRRLNL